MTHLTAPRLAGHASTASGRTLLIAALLLAGRAFERLAERLARAERRRADRTETQAAGREFHVIEQDGRHVGMLYEDGHLVALLPEIGRL